MSSMLSVVGFIGLLLALVGVCKGSLRTLGLSTRGSCAKTGAAAFAVMMIGAAMAPAPQPSVDDVAQEGSRPPPAAAPARPTPAARLVVSTPSSAAPAPAAASTSAKRSVVPPPAAPKPVRAAVAVAPLLVMAAGGDGDSWRDTRGVEYRMGLINTPETNECGGAAATAYRKQALARGFRAKVYSADGYGRKVAVIVAPNGVNLNVAMARDGIANDRYLSQFRHENRALAAQLDTAFREARAAGRGIWKSCSASGTRRAPAAQAPAPRPLAGGRCHPDYTPCIPLRGDGSGRGAANDLDCGEIGQPVTLRQLGRDPYRLDGNDRDGKGCE